MVRFLAAKRLIDKLSTKNSKGKTPLQICRESSPHTPSLEIENILSRRRNWINPSDDDTVSFLGKMSDTTMVVVVLIATMAFQAAVSPPGGVWQDDGRSPPHRAGEAVMASRRPRIFAGFKRANTVAFASSLVAIFLLSTELPSKHVIFTSAVVYAMWVSMAAIAVVYGASVIVITPDSEMHSLRGVIDIVLVAAVALIGMLCLAVALMQLPPWIKRKRRWLDATRHDPRFQTRFLSFIRTESDRF